MEIRTMTRIGMNTVVVALLAMLAIAVSGCACQPSPGSSGGECSGGFYAGVGIGHGF
jgi:hypothetical protein